MGGISQTDPADRLERVRRRSKKNKTNEVSSRPYEREVKLDNNLHMNIYYCSIGLHKSLMTRKTTQGQAETAKARCPRKQNAYA